MILEEKLTFKDKMQDQVFNFTVKKGFGIGSVILNVGTFVYGLYEGYSSAKGNPIQSQDLRDTLNYGLLGLHTMREGALNFAYDNSDNGKASYVSIPKGMCEGAIVYGLERVFGYIFGFGIGKLH